MKARLIKTVTAVMITVVCVVLIGLVYGLDTSAASAIMCLWAMGMGTAYFCITDKLKYTNLFMYGAAAMCLILWFIMCLNNNVEYDGGYTYAMVKHSFSDIVALTKEDFHSPLYYFLAKIGYTLCFKSIIGIKLTSFVFMIGYVLLAVFPVRKLFSDKMPAAFLIISAMMPGLIFHVSDARMYGIAATAVLATFILFVMLCKQPDKILYWVLFFLSSIFTMYIHTYAMFATFLIYVAMLCIFIIGKKFSDKRVLISFAVNACLVIVAYLPWLGVIIAQTSVRTGEVSNNGYVTNMRSLYDYAIEYFSFSGNVNKPSIVFFGLLVVLSLVYVIVRKAPNRLFAYIALGVFSTIILVCHIISVVYFPLFIGRYAVPCLGLLCLFVAYALSLLKNKKAIVMILLTVMMFGMLVYKDYIKLYTDDEGLHGYVEFINNTVTDEDLIIYQKVHTQYLQEFAGERNTMIYGNKLIYSPFKGEAFTDMRSITETPGNVYLVCLNDTFSYTPINDVTPEIVMQFHYMYYDVFVYKLNR